MNNINVLYEKKNQVAYITIDRPHVLNALDTATHQELGLIWDDFEKDETLRLAVLSGSGNRSFSVGQDLKELRAMMENKHEPSSFGSRNKPGSPRFTERFQRTKPVIARVNGYAFGGGFELVLASDIVIASETALFSLPEAKLGLIPGAGGVFRLSKQIPQKIAMGYLLTARNITANRAYELGLINQVVSEADLDSCVEHWVQDILRCAPLSIRSIKEAAELAQGLSIEEAFKQEYHWEKKRIKSKDCLEGTIAFFESRKPIWE